jgi:hypothetical protein
LTTAYESDKINIGFTITIPGFSVVNTIYDNFNVPFVATPKRDGA